MARKDNPYDNVAAESFIKTLKSTRTFIIASGCTPYGDICCPWSTRIFSTVILITSGDIEITHRGGLSRTHKGSCLARTNAVDRDYINLDMMDRQLLFVTMGLFSTLLGVLRQAVHSMAYQDEIDTTGRYLYPVIAHQVPGDACLSEVVSSA